jgi:hypothetical protein
MHEHNSNALASAQAAWKHPHSTCTLFNCSPAGSVVLDLMSSWVSHLPPEVKYEKVLGHGLNAAELAKNKQMDSFFVRDLNAEPDAWAMADQSVDAVLCCVRCAG